MGDDSEICLDAHTPDIAKRKQGAVGNQSRIRNAVPLVLSCDSLPDGTLDPIRANDNVSLERCAVLEVYDRSTGILLRNPSAPFVKMNRCRIDKLYKSIEKGRPRCSW